MRTRVRPTAAGEQRLREEVRTERGEHGLDALLAQRDRQRAEAQRVVELGPLRLVLRRLRAHGDDRLAAADGAIDVRSGDHLAVEGDRSRPVDVRRGEVAPDVAGLVAQRELDPDEVPVDRRRDARDVDLAAVEQDGDRPILDEAGDVLPFLKPLALGVDIALGIDELELPGRADEASNLVGVVDARDLDDDPLRAVSGGLGPHLRLVDADAGDASLDDRAGRLEVGRRDRLVALRLSLERHPDPALEVEPEHGPELGAGHLRGEPVEPEGVAGKVDEDRHEGDHGDHPRSHATPGHARTRVLDRVRGCRAGG